MKHSFICILLVAISMLFISARFTNPVEDIKTKAGLGKKLFLEKILSKDSSVSCGSCHKPQFAFADTVSFSVGIHGQLTTRNTPSVLNMKNRPYFFGMDGLLHWRSGH